jgi:hypothetical protein
MGGNSGSKRATSARRAPNRNRPTYWRPPLRRPLHHDVHQCCPLCGAFCTPAELVFDPASSGKGRRLICQACGEAILDKRQAAWERRHANCEGQLDLFGNILQNGEPVRLAAGR